ncbi:hypothetical protein [Haloferula sp. BvORR071]|uniref:hypothetical protein n=1 Tax=Haloferula sp. BvORR071 TaxID=1396141 RepID=UPI0005533601|nr:hypothetical protein [Haloferula sp. BvORR071]
MNPSDPILDSLLDAVKATKRRRQNRRTLVATCLACTVAASIPFLLPDEEDLPPMAAVPPPPAAPGPVVEASTLAMVVWQNGVPCLEELPAEELGLVQLNFGLQPVIAYPDTLWKDPWN